MSRQRDEGGIEYGAGAVRATAAAGRDAQFHLQLIEGGAALLSGALNVAGRDAAANTNDHGGEELR